MGQPTNFNRSDLDEAVAELPAMGIRLKHAKDGLKRSMSADQMSDGSARVSHKRADSVLLTPKTGKVPRGPLRRASTTLPTSTARRLLTRAR